MKSQMRQEKPEWGTVRLPYTVIERLQEHKEKTFVPVSRFVEIAVLKEFKRLEKKK